ncbi:serine/threonine protein kinase [Capronia epimyces CBS 606.96]|uniref:Serine/threonine protein kinase n=1 Tax=Capronia epimyces CBS 606.96 TaxID=1182542 RepID=W9YAZ2_9EURO|nr:serine/threonine protein kinase [Capronia epimyces CBS 606.96]EXJ79539.1 serine/threonine protein kinase [Capronia epimyces CBS 606.96]
MAGRSDEQDTQRLSEYERLQAAHLAVSASPVDPGFDEFARLVPCNPAARLAFHDLALELTKTKDLAHYQKFMHVSSHVPTGDLSAKKSLLRREDTDSDFSDSSMDQAGPTTQYTGHFRFSLSCLPTDFRRGWVVGAGRRDQPDLGVDFRITMNGARDYVRGRHVQFLHNREFGTFLFKAISTRLHTSLNGMVVDKEGCLVSHPSQNIGIGNLTYNLEFAQDDAVKARYIRGLHDLMRENPRFQRYPMSSFDPTPAANQYIIDRYLIQAPQAAGAYGVVSAAAHLTTGNVYAVKRLTRTDHNRNSIRHEVEIMEVVGNHPHVCSLVDTDFGKADRRSLRTSRVDTVHLILTPLATRTLEAFVGGLEARPLCLKALHHVAQGLRHIHAMGIIHRDVKPSNLLIAEPFRVVVADFGHSTHEKASRNHKMGTIWYLAPEIVELKTSSHAKGHWSPASDVFAYGLVGYELIHGEIRRAGGFINNTVLDRLLTMVNGSQEPIDTLLQASLSRDPDQRPSMSDICLESFWGEAETTTNDSKRKPPLE